MISIIIPAHREGEKLTELLSWILKMPKGIAKEIIVALSPESSTQLLNDFRHRLQIVQCKQKGRAAQMNEGALVARGETLVFLHADVMPPNTFLEDIHQELVNGFDAGFFTYKFDSDSFWLKINASFTRRDGLFTGGGDQCLFIRKSVFEKLGRFDDQQLLMEDFELFKRMKRERVPYTIICKDLIVSPRKYKYNSYLRVNLSNLLLVILFNVGYPSVKLKSIHDRLIRSS
jgi:glycosyltransferase involved in cell wall biosynthesis